MCGKCRESDLFMKIKTCELSGRALDFAVALIEGATYSRDFDEPVIEWTEKFDTPLRFYSPSTNWAQGGPIIERERITLDYYCNQGESRAALGYASYDNEGEYIEGSDHEQTGPTPLIAAMRCQVSSKLGPEVEIPGELL